MDPSRFIAGKLRFQGKLAAVSIAVSFLVMILAVAISAGFRHAVRDGVAAVTGDIQVTSIAASNLSESASIPASLSCGEEILAMPGVEALTPAVFRAGIVKSGEVIHGVLFKGVPDRRDSALTVSIPDRLSRITGLKAGDDMLAYFVGEKVKVRKFKVSEVYDDLLAFDNNLIVRAGIDDVRRINGWAADEASVIEVRLRPEMRSGPAVAELSDRIGTTLMLKGNEEEQALMAISSQRRYPQLFDWLNLLDFNVLFILLLMTAVAGFNMISGLLIMLFRNIPTIGTLKTLGMGDRGISKVFLRVAAGVVLKGMLAGNALALLFCWIQGATHLVKLDPRNYFVSFVPVHVNLPAILAADLGACVAIMLLLLIPTLFIARVDPAETVKAA